MMPSKRKFYRTIFKIEVLSEEPVGNPSLQKIAYQIENGDWSGLCEIDEVNTVDGPEMAKLLEAQQSDPSFFRLTEDGEDDY